MSSGGAQHAKRSDGPDAPSSSTFTALPGPGEARRAGDTTKSRQRIRSVGRQLRNVAAATLAVTSFLAVGGTTTAKAAGPEPPGERPFAAVLERVVRGDLLVTGNSNLLSAGGWRSGEITIADVDSDSSQLCIIRDLSFRRALRRQLQLGPPRSPPRRPCPRGPPLRPDDRGRGRRPGAGAARRSRPALRLHELGGSTPGVPKLYEAAGRGREGAPMRQAVWDVSSYVADRGAGRYTVADIVSERAAPFLPYASWAIAVAYEFDVGGGALADLSADAQQRFAARAISWHDGFVYRTEAAVEVPVHGFEIPTTGSVFAKSFHVVGHGRRGGPTTSSSTATRWATTSLRATRPRPRGWQSVASRRATARPTCRTTRSACSAPRSRRRARSEGIPLLRRWADDVIRFRRRHRRDPHPRPVPRSWYDGRHPRRAGHRERCAGARHACRVRRRAHHARRGEPVRRLLTIGVVVTALAPFGAWRVSAVAPPDEDDCTSSTSATWVPGLDPCVPTTTSTTATTEPPAPTTTSTTSAPTNPIPATTAPQTTTTTTPPTETAVPIRPRARPSRPHPPPRPGGHHAHATAEAARGSRERPVRPAGRAPGGRVVVSAGKVDRGQIRSITFPVAGPVMYSNDFGACRDGCRRAHRGNDLIGDRLQPILAMHDGVIDHLVDHPTAGYGVVIRDSEGYEYHVYHMNNDTPGTDDGADGGAWRFAAGIGPERRVGPVSSSAGWATAATRSGRCRMPTSRSTTPTVTAIDPYWSLRIAQRARGTAASPGRSRHPPRPAAWTTAGRLLTPRRPMPGGWLPARGDRWLTPARRRRGADVGRPARVHAGRRCRPAGR